MQKGGKHATTKLRVRFRLSGQSARKAAQRNVSHLTVSRHYFGCAANGQPMGTPLSCSSAPTASIDDLAASGLICVIAPRLGRSLSSILQTSSSQSQSASHSQWPFVLQTFCGNNFKPRVSRDFSMMADSNNPPPLSFSMTNGGPQQTSSVPSKQGNCTLLKLPAEWVPPAHSRDSMTMLL